MSRTLFAPSLFAGTVVALVAASETTACPPGFGFGVPLGPPVIYVPVYPAIPAPKIEPEPKSEPKRTQAPLPPPKVTVEPAAFAAPEPATPTIAPPKVPTTPAPQPEPAKPEVPKLELPKPEAPKVEAPKFETPKPAPKPEIPQVSLPLPAPVKPLELAKPADPEPAKIPTFTPKVAGTDATLPPLKLPPLPNVDPTSISRSSPLTGSGIDIVPADGKPAANGKRRVGFYNQTDRAVRLTVEGETVTLPGRHTIAAEVPATFTWTLDRGDPRSTTVPAGASGVEVLIRK